ncbi:DNA/RNA non-specific endonuclease [Rariglobus hedericola]|uniref:DNA/RNA non-specific endonuclease n=1 Tax=Rariglobus hedericola TaxID=2597822 RepID=A0A556QJW2_9BACT|nr:DNA/RNA non-specific endonuclease [Rariglobus hedericola]TSJ76901.1 DNA/RNA non-specific endonuclease [Rariglobus hedericola]
MSARARKGARRGGKIKAVFWFNVVLLAVMGGWFVMQPEPRRAEVSKLVENYFEKSKRIELLDVAQDIYRLYYSGDFVTATAAGDRTHIYGGLPATGKFPHAIRVLVNKGYIAGYCDALENPAWVAYRVGDVAKVETPAPRPDNFETDLRTAARVPSSAYTNSGYDRGHMAPNYAVATRYGEAAQRETFLMSNIAPQRHALNAGVWKEMEMKVATSYPGRFGEVWVLAGPVFGVRPAKLPNGTAVPEAFFMIVIDESDGRIRAQALIFPQEAPAGADARRFVVSIDEVERRTGLDFLTELDAVAEDSLESKHVDRVW